MRAGRVAGVQPAACSELPPERLCFIQAVLFPLRRPVNSHTAPKLMSCLWQLNFAAGGSSGLRAASCN
jgi:hypothetical protein